MLSTILFTVDIICVSLKDFVSKHNCEAIISERERDSNGRNDLLNPTSQPSTFSIPGCIEQTQYCTIRYSIVNTNATSYPKNLIYSSNQISINYTPTIIPTLSPTMKHIDTDRCFYFSDYTNSHLYRYASQKRNDLQ